MATIDSKEFIDQIIANNGWHDDADHDAPDNPRVALIVEYINAFGKRTWGVTFIGDKDINRYIRESEYIQDPMVIWNAEHYPIVED